jgi:hypothetical protein
MKEIIIIHMQDLEVHKNQEVSLKVHIVQEEHLVKEVMDMMEEVEVVDGMVVEEVVWVLVEEEDLVLF